MVQTASAGGILGKEHSPQGSQGLEPGRERGRMKMGQGVWRERWQPGQRHKRKVKELTFKTYYVACSELHLSTGLFCAKTHMHVHRRDVRYRVFYTFINMAQGASPPATQLPKLAEGPLKSTCPGSGWSYSPDILGRVWALF